VIDVAADAVVANDAVRAYDAEVTVPFTNDAVLANEAVTGTNVIDVAADAVLANDDVNAYDDEIELFAQLAVPKVEPLWVPMNDPVNEPVLTLNVIDVAADAVVANDAVRAYEAELTVPFTNDAVLANEAVSGTNVIDVAADDVRAYDEESTVPTTNEAVSANDDVIA
jgi:hypothetical protein